ncbi:MAG: YgjP-like metallopeptidase domain-containing protein [Sphingobium sp.]
MSSARSELTADPVVLVAGKTLPVVIRRYPKAKGYRLRYDATRGELRLSMPARGSSKPALAWVRSQEQWIARQVAGAQDMVKLIPGAMLPVEGMDREIRWARDLARLPVLSGDAVMLGGPEESVGARLVRWLRARALTILQEETLACAGQAGLDVTSVAIGDPRGRWGSCSSSGAIRYSWRLILAPPDVRRSTVAHEVAHLLHMDHSPAFHAAHRRLLGADPDPAREWLRRNGAGLHRFTA